VKYEDQAMKLTKLFFATDIHGSESCFLKFLSCARSYKADVAVLGGDLTGKMIVPIIEQGDNSYYCDFLEQCRVLSSEQDVEELTKMIRMSGFYPYRASPDQVEELASDPKKVDALFSQLMNERIERWVQIAETQLKPTATKIFVTAGNDDRFEIDDIIRRSDYVCLVEGEVVSVDEEHEMMSSGWTNPTPWRLPREEPEIDLERRLESMARKVKSMENCIFNLHVPPKDSQLDTCPQVDGSVHPPRLVTGGGGSIVMYGGGSSAVRDVIEKYQPLVGLHGHIHESRGRVKLGRTLCINPGSEYTEGVLRGAIVILGKDGKMAYQFTSA
jgi:uncharacterized protein